MVWATFLPELILFMFQLFLLKRPFFASPMATMGDEELGAQLHARLGAQLVPQEELADEELGAQLHARLGAQLVPTEETRDEAGPASRGLVEPKVEPKAETQAVLTRFRFQRRRVPRGHFCVGNPGLVA